MKHIAECIFVGDPGRLPNQQEVRAPCNPRNMESSNKNNNIKKSSLKYAL